MTSEFVIVAVAALAAAAVSPAAASYCLGGSGTCGAAGARCVAFESGEQCLPTNVSATIPEWATEGCQAPVTALANCIQANTSLGAECVTAFTASVIGLPICRQLAVLCSTNGGGNGFTYEAICNDVLSGAGAQATPCSGIFAANVSAVTDSDGPWTADCQFGEYCTGSRCTPSLAPGALCNSDNYQSDQCPPKYVCAEGGPTPPTCVRDNSERVLPGLNCSSNDDCIAYVFTGMDTFNCTAGVCGHWADNGACFPQFNGYGCNQLTSFCDLNAAPAPVCTTPRLPLNANCTPFSGMYATDAPCAEPNVCRGLGNVTGRIRACQPRVAAGGGCFANEECASGLRCNPDPTNCNSNTGTGICSAPGQAGDACCYDDQCDINLYCGGGSSSINGTLGRTCMAPMSLPVGTSCTSSLDCAPGLDCDFSAALGSSVCAVATGPTNCSAPGFNYSAPNPNCTAEYTTWSDCVTSSCTSLSTEARANLPNMMTRIQYGYDLAVFLGNYTEPCFDACIPQLACFSDCLVPALAAEFNACAVGAGRTFPACPPPVVTTGTTGALTGTPNGTGTPSSSGSAASDASGLAASAALGLAALVLANNN